MNDSNQQRGRGIQQNLSPNFQEPTWLNTLIQTFSFQNSEGVDICDFKPPVCGTLSQQSIKTNMRGKNEVTCALFSNTLLSTKG